MVAHAVYPGDPRLRRQADALARAGHEIDLFVLRADGEEAEEQSGSVRVVRLPVSRAFSGFAGHVAEYLAFGGIAAIRLAREHRRRRYRLVQVATVPDVLAFAAAPLIRRSLPSKETVSVSPSCTLPSRILRASGSCSSFWITRLSGRAP